MKNKIELIRERIEKSLSATINSLNQNEDKNFFLGPHQPNPESRLAPLDQAYTPLSATIRHTLLAGGKRWRAVLCVLAALLEKDNLSATQEQTLDAFTSLIECIHAASLIQDDIEDASEKRRGEPAAHIAFGLDTALNAGSWLYFFALRLLERAALDTPAQSRCYALVTQALYNLHLGQAMDINWHRLEDFLPSLAQYETMIRLKTGTLAGLAAALGGMAAGVCLERLATLRDLAQELGVVFQMQDDIQNITTGLPGKDAGDDIVEGKKSLVVIFHCAQTPTDQPRLIELFGKARKEGIHSEAVTEAIGILRKSQGISEARDYAKQKLDFIKTEIENHYATSPTKPLLRFFIDQLTAGLVNS